MVLLLADTLAVPLRERNALLLAAGFAPVFRESTLDDDELGAVRTAIDAILKQQEPYPAVVMNRHWDILSSNHAASRFFSMLLDGRTPPDAGNVLRLMFHPDGLRPVVENWEAVACALVRRVHREAVGGALDEAGRALLAEVLDYPGVPQRWRTLDLGAPLVPVVPVSFRHRDEVFHFFSAVTVLGTPQDVTLQDLRIESFFPLDEPTASAARRLLGAQQITRSSDHQITRSLDDRSFPGDPPVHADPTHGACRFTDELDRHANVAAARTSLRDIRDVRAVEHVARTG